MTGTINKINVGLEWLIRGRRKAFASRAQLEEWQHHKVLRFLKKTTRRSPALRQRFTGIEPERWRMIDPIGKTEMMATFDTLVTRPIDKRTAWETAVQAERDRVVGKFGSCSVGLSSGTSGSRGLFVVAPAEKARWAGAMLGRVLGEERNGNHRIALLLRANSGLYETLGSGRINFRYVDILQPPDQWMNELSAYDPSIIAAPPSILRQLAEAQGNSPRALSPRKIYGVAEVMDEADRACVKHAWGVPPLQIYQATEGFLGISGDENRLILNEDLMVIEQEWIDKSRKLFAPVITDFSRVTQPIVRYRLDDVLEETDAGQWTPYRAVSRIHGRVTDLLRLKTREGTLVRVTGDMVSRAVLTANTPPLDYEIIQEKSNELRVHVLWPAELSVDSARNLEHALEASIHQWCERSGFARPLCHFFPLAPSRSPAIKYRRVRQRMDSTSSAEVRLAAR